MSLILRRIHRLDLSQEATLFDEDFSVLLGDIREHCDQQRVLAFGFSQALNQANDSFPVVTVAGQERDVRTLWQTWCFGQGSGLGDGGGGDIRGHGEKVSERK